MISKIRLFFATGFWTVSVVFTFLDSLFVILGCKCAGITIDHYNSIQGDDEIG